MTDTSKFFRLPINIDWEELWEKVSHRLEGGSGEEWPSSWFSLVRLLPNPEGQSLKCSPHLELSLPDCIRQGVVPEALVISLLLSVWEVEKKTEDSFLAGLCSIAEFNLRRGDGLWRETPKFVSSDDIWSLHKKLYSEMTPKELVFALGEHEWSATMSQEDWEALVFSLAQGVDSLEAIRQAIVLLAQGSLPRCEALYTDACQEAWEEGELLWGRFCSEHQSSITDSLREWLGESVLNLEDFLAFWGLDPIVRLKRNQ